MLPISIEKARREITSLKNRDPHLTFQIKDRIRTLQLELGFLKMFVWFLPKKFLKKYYIRAAVGIGKGKLGLYVTSDHAIDRATSKLLQKVEFCKQKIREDCLHFLDLSFQCNFSSSYELPQFINCTLSNLRILVRSKAGAIVSVRMQARALIKKLRMFRDFVKSTEERWIFRIDIQDWACKVARLSVLFWVDQMEEAMSARMKAILTDLLQMVDSYSPEVVGLYLRVLKASKFSPFNPFVIGETVASSVDFILPIGFMKIIREELIFLIAFVLDPHPPEREIHAKYWNLVFTKAKDVACEIPSLIRSLTVGETNQEIAKERNVLLSDFREKTSEVKAEVRKLIYASTPESSRPRFPITNAFGFVDLLLENFGILKETLISQASFLSFARDQLVTLHKELVSLRPSLKNVQDMQNEFEELKDLWLQITDAAYEAEHVIDSCQIFDVPIWYSVICFSDLIEKIKCIKRQTEQIMDNPIYMKRILNAKVNSGRVRLGQAYTSRLGEVVVGFEDEAKTIIDRLTRGSMKLDIVSIVGMPGQGKTTLVKKVYNSPSIQFYFNRCAWCFVTQVYENKMLLLDILRDVTTMLDDEIHNMSKEDLAHKLYQCLKGQRYLIIMDDIWDITAWNAIKESFPDDNNGSRILFASRNKFVCNPHLLRPLSEEESMELLKQKLLPKESWPSSFSYDVRQILKVCNGLPLAIVVVAGLLQKGSNDLDQWRQIVQNLNPKLASEGCMDILELSYKNLPDFLKPCFLYLAAVGQTKVFKVHKLIQLWIAEGFVQKSGIKSLEEVAKEYLEDLVARSLVIVNKRHFSSGEIKECRIHDLLHELCLTKSEEERFMHFPDVPDKSSVPIIYDQYRLCIYNGWIVYSLSKPTGPNVRSLLIPPCNYKVRCPYESNSAFFTRLKFLKVLDLETVDFHHYFPEEVVLLIYLRYFSIKCEIKNVPSSIGNLCNLETFHVVREAREQGVLKFPHTIWKMKRLRNVDVGTAAIILLDDHDANVCPQLSNLDSFSSLYLCNLEDAEKLLRRFPGVRKLKLEFSESWDCRRNCDQFQVLHLLSKLESLNVKYACMAHTCAFNFPTALKKLTLSKFNRPWSEISTIGKLRNLEVLKFLDCAIVGERWDVEDEEFLNLKYLKLSKLCILHWEASTSSFPCLERLVVRFCPALVELPSIFVEVMTLKMIEVRGCLKGVGTSAESILNEQLEMGNEDLEILISDVVDERRVKALKCIHTHCGKGIFFKGFRWCNIAGLWNNQVSFATHDVRESLELEKKGVKKIHVPSVRRANLILKYNFQPGQAITSRHSKEELKMKHNFQPRQVIMSRHSKEELKRDG